MFKLVYNKSNEYVDVELMDFSNSGIMSNLELLIRLNDCIYDFYQTKFQSLLHVFDNNTRDKIVMLTNKFIYSLFEYTLKIISLVANKISDTRVVLKRKMANYSLWLSSRISHFINNEITFVVNKNEELNGLLSMNEKTKEMIKVKINQMINEITHQNNILKNDL